MEIIIQTQVTASKIISLNDIKEHSRVFYELGHWNNKQWVKSGVFKEILNVDQFIKNESRMNDLHFIEHHNFMII